MAETKFTPGPWAFVEIMPADKDWGACEIIARHGSDDEQFVSTHVCGIENAALIAAAPDLYAALESLVQDVASYPAWERPCAAVENANAALCKARGEPNA